MVKNLTRSDLFRSVFSSRRPVRPPWALPEPAFEASCTTCADCIPACPENILVIGRGGLPEVDFDHGECTFCEACLESCAPGALVKTVPNASPWTLVAEIADSCLSMRAIACQVCGDICGPGAIAFRLEAGGRAIPQLDRVRCTGCGACFAPCPVDAVTLHSPSTALPVEA